MLIANVNIGAKKAHPIICTTERDLLDFNIRFTIKAILTDIMRNKLNIAVANKPFMNS